jgi:NAD(P)-dependent dehydrogenase (short-subunit alcohol dehydrogenase family)
MWLQAWRMSTAGAPDHPKSGQPAFYRGRPSSQWIDATSRRQHRPAHGGGHDGASVALVTGGGRGFGRILAEGLAEAGVAVGLVARSADELDESVEVIEASDGVAAAVTADVTDERAIAAAISELRRRLGPIDLLVNNAGTEGPVGPAWEVDPGSWWNAIEVNLRGTFLCSRLALPDMVARRRGRIVNITSHAGVYRWPTVSAYSVSKAAVVKLTENLAAETRRDGVSVFAVHPCLLPIGLSARAMAGSASKNSYQSKIDAWVRNELARGRGADPARGVHLIVRLASGRYDELSGRQLSVDDDLDALVARIDDVRERELYVLGLQSSRWPNGVARAS